MTVTFFQTYWTQIFNSSPRWEEEFFLAPSMSYVEPLKLQCCAQYSIVHYNNIIMSVMVSQITSITIVYSTGYSGTDQRKHQSSASLAFVRRIRQWPVNSPHKGPVTWKWFHSRCHHELALLYWDFQFMQDILYLTLAGGQWGVFCGSWYDLSHNINIVAHCVNIVLQLTVPYKPFLLPSMNLYIS